MLEFSGLACKTHIVHIAHIARSPGRLACEMILVRPTGFLFSGR